MNRIFIVFLLGSLLAIASFGQSSSPRPELLNPKTVEAISADEFRQLIAHHAGKSDKSGTVIVVNFWATWCGPCLTEMPLLEKTMAKYQQDKDVVFLALSTDEEHDDVAPFIKQHKFKWPIAFADGLDAMFRISSIPTTIIFNRSGEISFRQAGFNPREDFVAKLSEKIEAAKK